MSVTHPQNDSRSAERSRTTAYAGALLVVAACTAASWLLVGRFDPRNLAMIYLLGIAFVATRFGRGPSVLASCLGVATLEFFFVPPYFRFTTDAQYLFTLAVMLGMALLISGMSAHIRGQAEEASRRAHRMQVLYTLTHELAPLHDPKEIASASARRLAEVFGRDATVLAAEPGAVVEPFEAAAAGPAVLAAARRAFERAREPGAGRELLQEGGLVCAPLVASQPIGVAVLEPRGAGEPLSPESVTLLELLSRQIAVAIERGRLATQAEAARLDVERERLRSALLSSVSHDLRTPLASITGAATSLLEEEALPPESRHELAAMVYEESDRLNRLVGNLLDMTRVRSGDLRVVRDLQSLEEVVGSALRRLRKVLREHAVQPSLARDLPLVPMDGVLVEQVFVNLLENAAKCTPPGSRIDVGAKAEGDWLQVEVADAGPGLPDGAPGRVFEPSTNGGPVGGLGLAICRAIVAAHGGRISAENRAGGGAVFRFSLPLAPVGAEAGAAEERAG